MAVVVSLLPHTLQPLPRRLAPGTGGGKRSKPSLLARQGVTGQGSQQHIEQGFPNMAFWWHGLRYKRGW